MKQILLAITFIFLFGLLIISTILFPTNYADSLGNPLNKEEISQSIPMVNFCELANNPEKYNDRTVQLKASLSLGLEGAWFSDSECGVNNAAIVSSENKEVWKTIEKARNVKNNKFLSNELNLEVVGIFKNIEYKDCCLIAPFQFEILKIEKVTNLN